MERLGVSISLTSGFHPESNGQVERVNQDVGRFLRSYCQDRPGHWAAFVPWDKIAQNSLRHSSTNLSPFQCVLGYQPVLAPCIRVRPRFLRWTTGSGVRRRHGKLSVFTFSGPCCAKRRTQIATAVRPRGPCRKLGPRFVGPFIVLRRMNEVCYRLQLPTQLPY